MKKKIILKKHILFIALVFAFLGLRAQQGEVIIPQTQYNISMGAGFGRGFFGESFSSTYIAPSLRTKLNDKTYLRVGVLFGDLWLGGNNLNNTPIDRAPYADRYKHNAAYMGMDFELSSKVNLFITAFYDRYNPLSNQGYNTSNQSIYTYGLDASLSYEISENSFLYINVSFMETNNPYMLIPYRNSAFNSMSMTNGGFFPNSRFSNPSPFGW